MLLNQPTSITHLHLLNTINTELCRTEEQEKSLAVVRVLDMGCGKGNLLVYLSQVLPLLHPELVFEFYGYDIEEHGARNKDYLTSLLSYLESESPTEPWKKRIYVISANEPLPMKDNFFQFIVSNQVFEHVRNHNVIFQEIHRCLADNGVSINLFPLRDVLYEEHLFLPLAHKIQNWDLLKSYIKLLNWCGLGRYSEFKEQDMSLEKYAQTCADYLLKFTNYQGDQDFLLLGKKHGLRPSFRYTQDFYFTKLCSLLKLSPSYQYRTHRSSLLDTVSLMFLKYVSSVTLVLEKA